MMIKSFNVRLSKLLERLLIKNLIFLFIFFRKYFNLLILNILNQQRKLYHIIGLLLILSLLFKQNRPITYSRYFLYFTYNLLYISLLHIKQSGEFVYLFCQSLAKHTPFFILIYFILSQELSNIEYVFKSLIMNN